MEINVYSVADESWCDTNSEEDRHIARHENTKGGVLPRGLVTRQPAQTQIR